MVLLALVLTAGSVASVVLQVYFGLATPSSLYIGTELVLPALAPLPLVTLVKGYRDGTHESRLRIRWVLWSTALLFGTVVATTTLSATREPILFSWPMCCRGCPSSGIFTPCSAVASSTCHLSSTVRSSLLSSPHSFWALSRSSSRGCTTSPPAKVSAGRFRPRSPSCWPWF